MNKREKSDLLNTTEIFYGRDIIYPDIKNIKILKNIKSTYNSDKYTTSENHTNK